MNVLFGLVILIVIVILALVYSLCVMASAADEHMEEK
jgi:hypothetical protein